MSKEKRRERRGKEKREKRTKEGRLERMSAKKGIVVKCGN